MNLNSKEFFDSENFKAFQNDESSKNSESIMSSYKFNIHYYSDRLSDDAQIAICNFHSIIGILMTRRGKKVFKSS